MKASLLSILFIVSLFSFHSAIADSPWSAGIGLQYGGHIGGQYSITNEKHRLNLALGLGGVAAGYEYAFSDKFAAGVGVTEHVVIRRGRFAHLNYYFSGRNNSGWMLGLDAGQADLGEFCFICSDEHKDNYESESIVLISLGYHF